MKSISASIVVLSGAILLAAGSFVPHGDTQLTLQLVGSAVGLLGLWAWFMSIKVAAD